MALVLVLAFLVLPFVELALIVAAAGSVGLPATFLALIVFSIAGAWLMRREGSAVWQRANAELSAGRVPTREILDGAMVLGGGALLLTPGFLTDFVGLLLLIPPVRSVLRPLALAAMQRRAVRTFTNMGGPANMGGSPGPTMPGSAGPGSTSSTGSTSGTPSTPTARVVRVVVNEPPRIDPPSDD